MKKSELTKLIKECINEDINNNRQIVDKLMILFRNKYESKKIAYDFLNAFKDKLDWQYLDNWITKEEKNIEGDDYFESKK